MVEMCGPRGAFEYIPGIAKWGGDRGAQRPAEHLILIGAGSGVAPMLQISNSVLANEEDNTAISMICCHKNLEEIIFRKELDEWAMKFAKKFSVRLHLCIFPSNNCPCILCCLLITRIYHQ